MPYPSLDASGDAERSSQAFVQAFVAELAHRLSTGDTCQDAIDYLEQLTWPSEPELVGLQWRAIRDMATGAALAAAAGAPETIEYDDAAATRDLEAARSAADPRAAFVALAPRLLGGSDVSAFLDMSPPNDGTDDVSAWLSGALLLKRALSQ